VKLLGDGVMAAFGVPHVAEDDALRAVRAGVQMQGAFRTLIALTPAPPDLYDPNQLDQALARFEELRSAQPSCS
jgi:class 3 adenylate cyclase